MGLSADVGLAVGLWVEVSMHVFFSRRLTSWRRRGCLYTLPGQVGWCQPVFCWGICAMFLLSTAHMVVNLYRFIRGFVLRIDPNGPYAYYFDFGRWDTVAHGIMLCMMTWLGDGLVIYRCYVIWDRKVWVTVLPLALLTMSITSNVVLLLWFTHPGSQSETIILRWMATVYPFAFGQNTITTGMIAFKIWRQHRASTIVGVSSNSTLSLLGVVRIIIESAMIYTLQLLILIILFPLHHNAQLIVQSAVIPSMGIVFVLIAVRVHFSRSRALFGDTVMASMPAWLNESSTTKEEQSVADEQHSPQNQSHISQDVDITQEKRDHEVVTTTNTMDGKDLHFRNQTTSTPS